MSKEFSSIPIINWFTPRWWKRWLKENDHEHQWKYKRCIKNYICPINVYDIVEFKDSIKIYECKVCGKIQSEIWIR